MQNAIGTTTRKEIFHHCQVTGLLQRTVSNCPTTLCGFSKEVPSNLVTLKGKKEKKKADIFSSKDNQVPTFFKVPINSTQNKKNPQTQNEQRIRTHLQIQHI